MVRRKAERNRFPASGAAGVQPPGTCLAGTISAVGGSVQGCRGLRPRRNKLKISPFPPGRGLGGWGQERKLKAAGAGDKQSKPPSGHRQHRNGKKAGKAGSPPAPGRQVNSQRPTINTYSLSRFPSWSAERHTDPNPPSRAPCRAHRARQTESPPHGRQDR